MKVIDIVRGGRTDEEQATETETEAEPVADDDTERGSSGGRRWLALGVLVVVGVTLYLLARRRAAREAEFTEIELDPAEPESAPTE